MKNTLRFIYSACASIAIVALCLLFIKPYPKNVNDWDYAKWQNDSTAIVHEAMLKGWNVQDIHFIGQPKWGKDSTIKHLSYTRTIAYYDSLQTDTQHKIPESNPREKL